MHSYPACFPSLDQYREWLHYARVAKASVNICHDCTPEYRRRMVDADRCHPHRRWGYDPDQRTPSEPEVTEAQRRADELLRNAALKEIVDA